MNKAYNTFLLLFFILLASCGEDNTADNKNDVMITTQSRYIGTSYVIIDGYINSEEIIANPSISSIGVEVSQIGDFSDAVKYLTDGIEGRKISVMVNELEANSQYYYRSFVQINSMYYYGIKQSFVTKDFTNLISTGEASNITNSTAVITSKLEIDAIDPNENYVIGVAFSVDKSKLHQDSTFSTSIYDNAINSIQDGKVVLGLGRLNAGETYYYCSFTRVGHKYKLGNIKSFKTLEGTWRGNMYMSLVWNGYTYDATSTEICFLRDPVNYSSGTGYWVDYYRNAPWGRDYVANHIDWTVRNGVIEVYFLEEGTTLWIEHYSFTDNYFSGTIYDGESRVNFRLYNVASPNWDEFYYGFGTNDSFYAKSNKKVLIGQP